MAWCFDDERTPATDALLDRVASSGAHAPFLWPLEVCNVLLMATRRKRIPASAVATVAERVRALPIVVDEQGISRTWAATLALAQRYQLTSYDACYLELAQRLALPLATLDSALKKAARSARVATL